MKLLLAQEIFLYINEIKVELMITGEWPVHWKLHSGSIYVLLLAVKVNIFKSYSSSLIGVNQAKQVIYT